MNSSIFPSLVPLEEPHLDSSIAGTFNGLASPGIIRAEFIQPGSRWKSTSKQGASGTQRGLPFPATSLCVTSYRVRQNGVIMLENWRKRNPPPADAVIAGEPPWGLPDAPSPQEPAEVDFLEDWTFTCGGAADGRPARRRGDLTTAVLSGLSLLLHHAFRIVRQLGKEKSQIFPGGFSRFSPTTRDFWGEF